MSDTSDLDKLLEDVDLCYCMNPSLESLGGVLIPQCTKCKGSLEGGSAREYKLLAICREFRRTLLAIEAKVKPPRTTPEQIEATLALSKAELIASCRQNN